MVSACGLKDDLTIAQLDQIFHQVLDPLRRVGSGGVVLAISLKHIKLGFGYVDADDSEVHISALPRLSSGTGGR